MKFPVDFTKNPETNYSVIRGSKGYIYCLGTAILFVASLIFIRPSLVYGLGIPNPIVVVLLLILCLFILLQVYRFVIFDERQKKREYVYEEENQLQLLWKIRSDSAFNTVTEEFKIPYTMMDYYDGNSFIVMQICHGRVLGEDIERNFDFLKALYNDLLGKNLSIQTILTDERYERDSVFSRMEKHIEGLEIPRFKSLMLKLMNFLKRILLNESRIPTTFIFIKGSEVSHRYSMGEVVDNIMLLSQDYPNSFRELRFLDEKGIYGFCKDYLGLEILDLSMVKKFDLKEDFVGVTCVAEIIGSSGKKYMINDNPVSLNTKARWKRGRRRVSEHHTVKGEETLRDKLWSLEEEVEIK